MFTTVAGRTAVRSVHRRSRLLFKRLRCVLQGEANTENAKTAEQYSCLFPQMISAWREAFQAPSLWFGFVQLSTWCSASSPASLPQMREAQMAALALPHVGYATNADHGDGCAIHPAAKQYCSVRLARSALAMHYNRTAIAWKSPSYKSATLLSVVPLADSSGGDSGNNGGGAGAGGAGGGSTVSVSVSLHDVSAAGLHAIYPANYDPPQIGSNWSHIPGASGFGHTDCSATFPATWPNGTNYNASMELQCAWASIEVGGAWHNASANVGASGKEMVLTAAVPASSVVAAAAAAVGGVPLVATATSYGWGPIPMMNIYNKDSDLPVLAWNKPL